MRAAELFIDQFKQWAARQGGLEAVALVGSWARDAARDDSDVDLVMITGDPGVYLADERWLTTFGEVDQAEHEDWGLVQSKRVFYKNGLEVEFGVTTPEWAQTEPLDPGTEQVVKDGMKVLYDRSGLLQALLAAVEPG